jgi:hypothetical protein
MLALLASTALTNACGDEDTLMGPKPDAGAALGDFDGGATGLKGIDGGKTAASLLDADLSNKGDGSSRANEERRAPDGGPLSAELCDGFDNDGNGTVDDVDVQRDGVCDCLSIATLGGTGRVGDGSVFGAWLNARSDKGAVRLGDATLTPELLRKYQVIVAEDLSVNHAYSADEINALEAWIKAGGGFLTMIGYASPEERNNVNAVLARFGMAYGPEQILKKSGAMTVPVRTWLGPHPVVDGVMKVGVDNGYPVTGGGTPFAREGMYDVLKGLEVEQGHLLVFGDEWITYNSEWSLVADYQVERLWLNMIKWLTVQRVCQVPVIYL